MKRFLKSVKVLVAVILVAAVGFFVWINDKYTVPILMFHSVHTTKGTMGITVSPQNFAYQMNFLKKNGYNVISLDRLVAAIKKNGLTDVIAVAGKPCWQVIIFKGSQGFSGLEIKSYVQQEFLQRGILWYGQHNMSYSHTVADVNRLVKAYDEVLAELKKLLESKKLRQALRGKPITDIFSVR